MKMLFQTFILVGGQPTGIVSRGLRKHGIKLDDR